MFITKKLIIFSMFAQAGKEKTTVHKEHLIDQSLFTAMRRGKRLAAYCHKITASVKKLKISKIIYSIYFHLMLSRYSRYAFLKELYFLRVR